MVNAAEALSGGGPRPLPEPDWERFYRDYRKPGFIPGYEILHRLGGGVFGVVFKARKESIGKDYAIKFLKVDDPGVRAQVLHELEAVELFAQVDHPNLVSIEDRGVVCGIPYIIMGYAGEETLKSRLEEGPLPENEVVELFVQIVRGVQALHERSLVHFDLKPANIFLKGDVARVGDYGLSKLVGESRMSLSFGRGTPYYMAPEMLKRKGDHRSDIYSLGVILYECLCGEPPFQGGNEWEILKAHEECAPDLTRVPARYRPILARMLAKDPGERCQDLREVLAALGASDRAGESLKIPPAAAGSQSAASSRAGHAVPPEPPPLPKPPPLPDAPRLPGPVALLAGLARALAITVLLPVRILGIVTGQLVVAAVAVPLAILRLLGRLTVVVLLVVVAALVFAFFQAGIGALAAHPF